MVEITVTYIKGNDVAEYKITTPSYSFIVPRIGDEYDVNFSTCHLTGVVYKVTHSNDATSKFGKYHIRIFLK